MKKIILIPSYEPDIELLDLIKKINRNEFDIIIVNDGSSKYYDNIFKQLPSYIKLISYKDNMGKGYALKRGLKYIKDNYNGDYIIVTMDSDGQHTIKDAKKLVNYIEKFPNNLVLGKRIRNNNTPLRSKIGNNIIRFIYKVLTNLDIYDTQTGLRAFSNKLVDCYLKIPGNRFEYEMNVLLYSKEYNISIIQYDS